MCSCKLLAAKRCACCTPPHASSCHVTRGGCLPLLTTTSARVACQHSRFELVSSRVRGMLGVLWCRCFLSVMVQSPPSPPRCCGLLLACRQRAAVALSRLRGCRRHRCARSLAPGSSCARRPREPAQQAAWWPSHSPAGHSPAQHTPSMHPASLTRLCRPVWPNRKAWSHPVTYPRTFSS